MSCRVQGEGKSSKPLVQLAMRHVTCVEDATYCVHIDPTVYLWLCKGLFCRKKDLLVILSSLGKPRNKLLSLALLPKQNTAP